MADEIIEREKLEFERERWRESKAIEEERLRLQSKSMWVSSTAIVIPLLVVAVTIYCNTHAQRTQNRADFDLRAAQVVLEPKTVTESINRAEGLVAMFPDRFPADLSSRLEPMQKKLEGTGPVDIRGLLNLLVAAPKERRKEVLDLWFAFYPKDREKIPEEVVSLLQHP